MNDTTPGVLERAAALWPDAEAVVDGEVRLTFAQLRELVHRAAHAAMAAGVAKGDRAAIWAPNSWQWIVAGLGVQEAGGVIVPMSTRYKGDEAAYLLRRSGAKLLFTVQGFLGVDYLELLEGRDHPVETTVVFGTGSWKEYLDGVGHGQLPDVDEGDVSDIIFTSGTTGRPKGVVAVHRQTVGIPRSWAQAVGLRQGDRYLLVSPFSHASGYKAGFVGALLTGSTIHPMAVADTEQILDLVSRERISMLPGTPTLFLSILNHPERQRYDLSSLRLSAVGAASVPVELVRRMKAELFETVITGYGWIPTLLERMVSNACKLYRFEPARPPVRQG